MPKPFRFAAFAYQASSGRDWADQARRLEALGFDALVMPDHFRNPLTPTPALAMAAAVTTTLRVGAVVYCNDFRHPALLAKEMAVLDLLSDGRVELGLGAGWFQTEYEQIGLPFDPPGVRITRMEEALAIIRALWADGPVHHTGAYYTIDGLEGVPKPVQKPGPPVFIGGSGKRMLSLAGREADVVGILPWNLPRGGHDWLASTPESVDERIGWVRDAAGARFDRAELSMVAFRAIVTDNPAATAAALAPEYGITGEQLLASPDFLIGTVDGLVERLLERRERFGISHVELPATDAAPFAPVLARLKGR